MYSCIEFHHIHVSGRHNVDCIVKLVVAAAVALLLSSLSSLCLSESSPPPPSSSLSVLPTYIITLSTPNSVSRQLTLPIINIMFVWKTIKGIEGWAVVQDNTGEEGILIDCSFNITPDNFLSQNQQVHVLFPGYNGRPYSCLTKSLSFPRDPLEGRPKRTRTTDASTTRTNSSHANAKAVKTVNSTNNATPKSIAKKTSNVTKKQSATVSIRSLKQIHDSTKGSTSTPNYNQNGVDINYLQESAYVLVDCKGYKNPLKILLMESARSVDSNVKCLWERPGGTFASDAKYPSVAVNDITGFVESHDGNLVVERIVSEHDGIYTIKFVAHSDDHNDIWTTTDLHWKKLVVEAGVFGEYCRCVEPSALKRPHTPEEEGQYNDAKDEKEGEGIPKRSRISSCPPTLEEEEGKDNSSHGNSIWGLPNGSGLIGNSAIRSSSTLTKSGMPFSSINELTKLGMPLSSNESRYHDVGAEVVAPAKDESNIDIAPPVHESNIDIIAPKKGL